MSTEVTGETDEKHLVPFALGAYMSPVLGKTHSSKEQYEEAGGGVRQEPTFTKGYPCFEKEFNATRTGMRSVVPQYTELQLDAFVPNGKKRMLTNPSFVLQQEPGNGIVGKARNTHKSFTRIS